MVSSLTGSAVILQLEVGDKRLNENIKAIIKSNLNESGVVKLKLNAVRSGLAFVDAPVLDEAGLTL